MSVHDGLPSYLRGADIQPGLRISPGTLTFNIAGSLYHVSPPSAKGSPMPDPQTVEGKLEAKGSTHGSFKVNARTYRELCGIVQRNGAQLNAEQSLALDQMFVSVARILAGDPNFRRHWDRIAGFAKLGAEACE